MAYTDRQSHPTKTVIKVVINVHNVAGLKRVVVSTYQAVSGAGKQAMDALGEQVQALLSQREVPAGTFSKRIAFNCLPHIDVFEDDDFTREEHKMREETRKIMDLPDVGVCATCVRVPVFNGHAESLVAEFERGLSPNDAREALKKAPGILLMDGKLENGARDYPTQVDAEGQDATLVGRIRADPSAPGSLALWCVADNLRKGAATNAVQIAEILIRDYL